MPRPRPKGLPTPDKIKIEPKDLIDFRVIGSTSNRQRLGHKMFRRGLPLYYEPATEETYLIGKCRIVTVWRGLELIAAPRMPISYYANLDWPAHPSPYKPPQTLGHAFPTPDAFSYADGDTVEFHYRMKRHTYRGFFYQDPDAGAMLLRRRARKPLIPFADIIPLRAWRGEELVAQIRTNDRWPFISYDRKEHTCR